MNYVISIINPDALEALTEICEKLSLPLTVTLHGRGTAMQGMLDLLGIESNEKRVVLTAANEEKTAQLIAAQRRYLPSSYPKECRSSICCIRITARQNLRSRHTASKYPKICKFLLDNDGVL